MLANCGHDLEWNNCYGTNKKYWAKSAFEHPAKASPDLCNKIIDHLEELGILTENSIVIDPLAGIGTSLLTAAVRGYKTIGVELEPKFVDLINKNISFVKEKEYLDYTPIIIQGDARKLSELLTERNLILITSPPYGLGKGTGHSEGDIENSSRDIKTSKKLYQYYGESNGNIGNMPNNVVITSPPYVGSDTTRIRGRKGDIERMIKKGIKVNPDSNSQTTKELYYGTSLDQIGNLKDGMEVANTYQGAMLAVYREMYKCCSAAAIITKNPTKKMRIYPLDKITISLLELAGWKIKCIHHAILCWEEIEDNKKVLKGRVGFFKRLQWSKRSPIAMWEDIITVVK